MAAVWRRRPAAWGAIVVFVGVLLSVPSVPPVHALGSFGASLEFTVLADAYENVVRVAPPETMEWPRVLSDRNRTSPFFGSVYVVGTKQTLVDNALWSALVVSRSTDGGRTFDAPRLFEAFRSVTFSSLVQIVDFVVGSDGALYLAFEGNGILRSTDGGLSWHFLRIFDGFTYVTALAAEPGTGVLYAVAATTTLYGNPPELIVASSADDGATWSAPLRITVTDAAFVEEPKIAVLPASLVIGYASPANVSGRWQSSVVALTSSDRGATWSTVVVRAGAEELYSLRLETSPEGVLGFAWRETWSVDVGGGNSVQERGIFVAQSTDGGRTFSPRVEVVVGSYDMYAPEVAFVLDDLSRAFVAWSIPPTNATDTGSLYAAVSNATGLGFDSASFHSYLQWRDGYLTAQEDLGAGTNGTVYLTWSSLNWLDPANFTVDNETSGIFLRTVAGAAQGDVVDTSNVLGNTSAVVDLRGPRGTVIEVPLPPSGGSVTLDELSPADYDVWIRTAEGEARAGSMPVRAWSRTSFTVQVAIGSGPPPGESPWLTAAAIAGLLLFAALFAAFEYTRITRDNVFQNRLRLLVYEYVKENPGASFSQIRDTFALQNGAAAHHLAVLERGEFLHSEARGRHRWYYANGDVSVWKDLPLSPLQAAILNAVRTAPGIGVRELARAVGRRSSSVADNVKILAREGMVRTARDGRRLRCFPVEAHATPATAS